MFIETVMAIVCCAPAFFLLKEKPPTPPSPSAEVVRENAS